MTLSNSIALILLSIAVAIAAPVFALGFCALVGHVLDLNHGQSPRERVSGWVIEWDGVATFVPNVYAETTPPPDGDITYEPGEAPGTCQETETVVVGGRA